MIKRKSLSKKLSLSILLGVCVILGAVIGTGIAYADTVEVDLSTGTHNYYTNMSGDYYGNSWSYTGIRSATMSSDKTTVTFTTDYSTTYTNGSASDSSDSFGPLTIMDESGYHSVPYYGFMTLRINNCPYYYATSWTYNGMNSNDSVIDCQQVIWSVDEFGDWTSLGADYFAYVTQ